MFKTTDQTFPFSRPFCVWNALGKIFVFGIEQIFY